jgi:hypothetical protein
VGKGCWGCARLATSHITNIEQFSCASYMMSSGRLEQTGCSDYGRKVTAYI